MSSSLRDHLIARLSAAQISIGSQELDQLQAYFRLLSLWNKKINLTGFDLESPSDHALDRLLCEPLAAADHFRPGLGDWVDVGSGGGSPAVPLKIVRPYVPLTMVEMRSRKAAFLREVSRELELTQTAVSNCRLEDLGAELTEAVGVVTIRAVRVGTGLSAAISRLLQDHGFVLVFGDVKAEDWPEFRVRRLETATSPRPRLVLLEPARRDVPRGTRENG